MFATWIRSRVAFVVFLASLAALVCGTGRSARADTWSMQQELLALDGTQSDQYGYVVATVGNTIFVAAPTKTVGGNANQGAVYVITLNHGRRWIQQAELTASDGAAGDDFGSSLAVVGNTLVVGAVGKSFGGQTLQGGAYVFTFNGTNWVQTAEITANDGAPNDAFGASVALTGNTVLVGAPSKTVASASFRGAVYVFTFDGVNWVEQAELSTNNGTSDDSFGRSLAVSGSTAIIGASTKTIAGHSLQGAAFVYAFNGTSWLRQAELVASDGEGDDTCGFSVAVSGNTALMGCTGKDVGSNFSQGAVYVFTSNGGVWTQQAELTASDGAALDLFGNSVAFSGNTALIGAPSKLVGSTAQGGAYFFATDGTNWTQQAELLSNDGAVNDSFGGSAAISQNNQLIVGAFGKSAGANTFQGAAYVFEPTSELIATPALPVPAAVALFGFLGLLGAVVTGRRARRAPTA